MQVYGPSYLHGPQPIGAPHINRSANVSKPNSSGPIQDELELSDAAQFVQKAKELPDIRWDRVNQIRAQIEAGTYETPDKLEIAIKRLLDEIA